MTRAGTLLAVAAAVLSAAAGAWADDARKITEGTLSAMTKEGKPLGDCPLKHTSVQADISVMLARVTVKQEFTNPFTEKIEAIYVFPLGASAAVDDMTMQVGERTIRGQIKTREEAKAVYEKARAAGHVASLLDQERPNIFTQSVANIEPGKNVTVTISYVELLGFEQGVYKFAFPMVVGPRYIPGQPVGKEGTGWAPDTTQVPDASKITPPVTPKGTRAGHDISVSVRVNAGLAIRDLASRQHKVKVAYDEPARTAATVDLEDQAEIPNRDFVLEYSTATDEISDAVLCGVDERGGFFTLILQPPRKVQPSQIAPREIIFVIDTSGSQMGFPIEISKAIVRRAIEQLREKDTFNLITFAGSTHILWKEPKANTPEARKEALGFVDNLAGRGGTEMMTAIHAALGGAHDKEKIRIVAFFTDGYVGNDMAIIDAVQKNAATSRVFSFGIGTSVNRFLLDGMARAGRGEVEYALSKEQGEKVADKFYDRIDAPVLTDVGVDWGELTGAVQDKEVYPRLIPDLFSVKPVIVAGRYNAAAANLSGRITLRGRTSEGHFERKISVSLSPKGAKGGAAIPTLWARTKIEHLMNQDLAGIQSGSPKPEIKESIVGLGLSYRLMTQFTSFVAVEEKVVTEGGVPKTVTVPVEMPQGVSYEGVFGEGEKLKGMAMARMAYPAMAPPPPTLTGAAGGFMYAPSSRPGATEPGKEVKEMLTAIRQDANISEADKKAAIAALKLSSDLQGLAAKLDKAGNYASGGVVVKASKVGVQITLSDMGERTLAALKAAGFVKTSESKTLKTVTGTIDVPRLQDIAQLDEVLSIEPCPASREKFD